MNINASLIVTALCWALSLSAANIATWDFKTGKASSLDGKYEFQLQNNSSFTAEGLQIKPAGDLKHGLSSRKVYPELTPQGSFELAITFKLDAEAAGTKAPEQIYLWDNKYIAWPNADQAYAHKGFCLFLSSKDGRYAPRAAFGYGERSASILGSYLELNPNQEHTLTLRYDQYGKASLLMNGKACGEGSLPEGSITAASLPTHIGDRHGSTHWPLPGSISKVVLDSTKTFPKGMVEVKKPSHAVGTAPNISRDDKTIAAWDFSEGSLVSKPGNFRLLLRGDSQIVKAGQSHALYVKRNDTTRAGGATSGRVFPALTPQGPFSVTVSFWPAKDAFDSEKSQSYYLLDNKYIISPNAQQQDFHNGFSLVLRGNKDQLQPVAYLGFGEVSSTAVGEVKTLALEQWHTLKMQFNLNGQVKFWLDGEEAGVATVTPGSLAASKRSFSIGDRFASSYFSFDGYIGSVVMQQEEGQELFLLPSPYHRRVFMRLESQPKLHYQFANYSKEELRNLSISAQVEGIDSISSQHLANMPSNNSKKLHCVLDNTLLPGDYKLKLKVMDQDGSLICQESFPFSMVKEREDIMPVVMWGGGQVDKLKQAGFTHYIMGLTPSTGELRDSDIINGIKRLDHALKNGLYAVDTTHGHYRFKQAKRFLRTDRSGQLYPEPYNIEASNPAVQKEFSDLLHSLGKAFGEHPAWNATLLNSEVRDSSRPSFGGAEPANFKAFAGYDIPEDITGKYPPAYHSNPALPWNKVLPDDNPYLVFFRWFWKVGDGWNPLHGMLTKVLHEHIKHPFWTFYDPVVRVPPLWGSGGDADVVSQWTYTYPDPIKIGQATDEVIAMAQGNPGQKPMSMTQAIWYRSQTAPIDQKPSVEPEWFSYEKDAKFISIAPTFLSEAVWSKVSRRIDGIMYHGYPSLIEKTTHRSYCYTNPESKAVLAQLSEELLRPLGPLLKRIPEHKPTIGILQSFTSTLYTTGVHSFGWSRGWSADLHLALQWAHLQPTIFYEEHLLRGDVDADVKALLLPGVSVLSESVLAALQSFQQRGGILIGDEYSNAALRLDYRLKSFKRKIDQPVEAKAALQAMGAEIRELLLAANYQAPLSASSPDLVLRHRGSDKADYLFVINDKREFGNYVGQWGLVQEQGLPQSGIITVENSLDYAYDLVKHSPVPLQKNARKRSFAASLEPGAGMLVLFLENKIASLRLQTETEAARGTALPCTVSVLDSKGRQIPALLPIKLTLTDPAGLELPGSGYFVAEMGKLELAPVLASNQQPGSITLTVQCLASGKNATAFVKVK